MKRESERSGGKVASALHLCLGVCLVFLLNLLVGAALGSATMASGSSLLAQMTGVWAGCLGVTQLVYLLPLFLVCWRVKRPLALGVGLGAVLVVVLQILLYLLLALLALLALGLFLKISSHGNGPFES